MTKIKLGKVIVEEQAVLSLLEEQSKKLKLEKAAEAREERNRLSRIKREKELKLKIRELKQHPLYKKYKSLVKELQAGVVNTQKIEVTTKANFKPYYSPISPTGLIKSNGWEIDYNYGSIKADIKWFKSKKDEANKCIKSLTKQGYREALISLLN